MSAAQLALVSEGIDHALLDAMRKINMAQPGLVAKQLHAELLKQDEQRWGHVTVGEVKRMYVKMAKAEVAEHAAEAGPFQHLMPSTSSMSRDLRTADEVARDLFADPISRDSERMKVSRPGLAARGTTLHKGDRLGTAAERGDTQQIINNIAGVSVAMIGVLLYGHIQQASSGGYSDCLDAVCPGCILYVIEPKYASEESAEELKGLKGPA
jgi:hypothetical protein